MALGGGTFTVQNKILPGAYINFVSVAKALGGLGERGVVAVPLEMNWGPTNEVMTIELDEFEKESLKLLGYSYSSDELRPLREVFRGAKMIKLYRLNSDGVKATATIGVSGVKATAKYSGTRGNDIKIVVQTNIDDETNFDVLTYLGTSKVDTQTVKTSASLIDNDFVIFAKTGALEVTAGVPLTTGTNGTVAGEAYSAFLDKIEAEDFTTLLYAGEDAITKALFTSFTKRLTEDEGVKINTVLFDYIQADNVGITSVKNNKELVYWTAGKSGGAAVNQSLTNKTYDGEYGVNTKFKKREYKQFIKDGQFCFYQDGEDVKVLTDINTFTSFTPMMNDDFSSNRVMRVLNQIANDTARIFSDFYLGDVDNNDTGRDLFKSELVNHRETLQGINAIENFKEEDITIVPGATKKDVVVSELVQPTDSMEKLYMGVMVK